MDAVASDTPNACENCGTVLQGEFCHACGQSAHNPLRHAAHAVEEVFESFWHLDGRVFRTLRDLLVPGRVACNYLKGQRVRYIAPLRLFVVLSVLTFFIGRFFVAQAPAPDAAETRTRTQNAAQQREFARAKTVDEVENALRKSLAELAEAREATVAVPGMASVLDDAEGGLRAGAELRARELGGRLEHVDAARAQAVVAGQNGMKAAVWKYGRERLRDRGKPWDPEHNPIDFRWVPSFADGWANHKLANIERNGERVSKDPRWFATSALSVAPTGLFLLMPIFAVLLKLFYVRHRYGVLEHLVVALYSHAYLLLTLLAVFAANLLGGVSPGAVQVMLNIATGLLIGYVPVYLLLMQKRVYAQSWPKTTLKYLMIGFIYYFMFVFTLAIVLVSVFFAD